MSGVAGERQRGQVDAGGPALGAGDEQLDVGAGELEPEPAVEELARLLGREAQVVGAQLEQLAAGAQRAERQRRVGAAWRARAGPSPAGGRRTTRRSRAPTWLESRWKSSRTSTTSPCSTSALTSRGSTTSSSGAAATSARERLVRRAPGTRGTSASIACDHSTTASSSPSSSVTHATGRRAGLALAPRGQQRRLAEPGRARDEAEPPAAAVAQPLEQPLARDRLRRDGRRVQLGEEQDRSVLTVPSADPRRNSTELATRWFRAPVYWREPPEGETAMEKHGSESYFVVGEGLLAESGNGRVTAGAAKAAPPFRFSRMGPKGTGKQLGEPNRTKLGALMAAGGGETSKIPSGFTYLGQFIDHDLTFDKTNVMLGANVSPARAAAGALAQPRPRLALRRRPAGPGVGEVLRGRRHAPQDGQDGGRRRHPRQERLRPPARRRLEPEGQAQGDHPRPAQRREPRGRPDPPGDGPLPQPRARHAAGLGAGRRSGSRPPASSSPSTTSG